MAPLSVCVETVRRLWDFLDGELGADAQRAVHEHLTVCAQCTDELGLVEEIRRLLRASAAHELPRDVQDRLERFIADLDDPKGTDAIRARAPLRACTRPWGRAGRR